MKRLLISVAYAVAGLLLAIGLTAAAYAIGGRDLSEPARPFKLDQKGNPQQGAVDDGKQAADPDDSSSPEDEASPDDKSGDSTVDEPDNSGSGSSNSGSGSSNSGSGSSNSGSGSGDDPDDD